MNIPTEAPIFYPNNLRVLSVVGNTIKVQYNFYWDTKDIRQDLSLEEILLLGADFHHKVSTRFRIIPDVEVVSDYLMGNVEDLDWYLADDCNLLVGKYIQDNIIHAIDQIV